MTGNVCHAEGRGFRIERSPLSSHIRLNIDHLLAFPKHVCCWHGSLPLLMSGSHSYLEMGAHLFLCHQQLRSRVVCSLAQGNPVGKLLEGKTEGKTQRWWVTPLGSSRAPISTMSRASSFQSSKPPALAAAETPSIFPARPPPWVKLAIKAPFPPPLCSELIPQIRRSNSR